MSLAKGSPIQYDDVNVLRNEGVLSSNGLAGKYFIGTELFLGDTLTTTTSTQSDGSIQHFPLITNHWVQCVDSEGNLFFKYGGSGQIGFTIGTTNKSS